MLEKAIDWVSDLEAQVLEEGVELSSEQMLDARLAGVTEPARIRLQVAKSIPLPDDVLLSEANRQVNLLRENSRALTAGYGIVMRHGCHTERRLLVHEFVHVSQHERFGGLEGFIREFLSEVLRNGMAQDLENEAEERAEAIAGKQALH